MLEAFGETQQRLLKLLLQHRSGLTADALGEKLAISRTAVRQHLSTLERDGYLESGERLKTGGRPGRVYVLSAKGHELFPRKYSWFSELLLEAIRREKGSEGLRKWLAELGKTVAAGLGAQGPGRPAETVELMNGLGFDARVGETRDGRPSIEARNCIYHHLAARHPEVCEFDLALLAKLQGSSVRHEECLLRGGQLCRFSFAPRRRS